jgi:hypothetical protein
MPPRTWSKIRKLLALPFAVAAFAVGVTWLRYLLLATFALLIAGDLLLEERSKRRS